MDGDDNTPDVVVEVDADHNDDPPVAPAVVVVNDDTPDAGDVSDGQRWIDLERWKVETEQSIRDAADAAWDAKMEAWTAQSTAEDAQLSADVAVDVAVEAVEEVAEAQEETLQAVDEVVDDVEVEIDAANGPLGDAPDIVPASARVHPWFRSRADWKG